MASHMVKENSDREKGNPLPPHELHFPMCVHACMHMWMYECMYIYILFVYRVWLHIHRYKHTGIGD